jgi:tetratricopeptide (TPR) repeat protein
MAILSRELARRRFLSEGILAAGGALVAGALGPLACRNRAPSVRRYYRPRHLTIAHRVLDIELELEPFGPEDQVDAYILLDRIIDVAADRIWDASAEGATLEVEAVATLELLAGTLDDLGFRYGKVSILSEGLKLKELNCDCYSAIYLALGEALDLPLRMVRAPAHTFVRWQLDDRTYIDWETTIGAPKDDDYYVATHRIAPEAVGVSALVSLDPGRDRERILANAYVNSGVEWLKRCRPREAIARFEGAAELDPDYETPCYNLGLSYFRQGALEQAIEWCERAVTLNPNHVKSHAVLRSAYDGLGDLPRANAHFERVIALDADFYSRSAIARRIRSRESCS